MIGNMPSSRQEELFPEDTPPPVTELRVAPAAGKSLTKRQKQFDRQLRKLEKLRLEYERNGALWEQFLKTYERSIRPAELAENGERKAFIQALIPFWRRPGSLGVNQRDVLLSILEDALQTVLEVEPELWESGGEFRQLSDELSECRRASALEAHHELRKEMQQMDSSEVEGFEDLMREMLSTIGLDGSRFSPEMDPDSFFAEFENQMRNGMNSPPESEEPTPDARARRKPTAAQRRAAAKEEEREKARQRSLSAIYKQLAKVVHPDLESDPERRLQKQRVMQELTRAHRERDLHTLLRLELEWLEGENDRLSQLTDEKLKVYLEVLREQIQDLEQRILGIPDEPRFQCVQHFADRWRPVPAPSNQILRDIEERRATLQEVVAGLSAPRQKARRFLRQMIGSRQEHLELEKRYFSMGYPQ
jgi:hypothetical protein